MMPLRGLVLTRRTGERITINNGEIIIEIARIKGGNVKLMFQASKDIKIERVEKPKEGNYEC